MPSEPVCRFCGGERAEHDGSGFRHASDLPAHYYDAALGPTRRDQDAHARHPAVEMANDAIRRENAAPEPEAYESDDGYDNAKCERLIAEWTGYRWANYASCVAFLRLVMDRNTTIASLTRRAEEAEEDYRDAVRRRDALKDENDQLRAESSRLCAAYGQVERERDKLRSEAATTARVVERAYIEASRSVDMVPRSELEAAQARISELEENVRMSERAARWRGEEWDRIRAKCSRQRWELRRLSRNEMKIIGLRLQRDAAYAEAGKAASFLADSMKDAARHESTIARLESELATLRQREATLTEAAKNVVRAHREMYGHDRALSALSDLLFPPTPLAKSEELSPVVAKLPWVLNQEDRDAFTRSRMHTTIPCQCPLADPPSTELGQRWSVTCPVHGVLPKCATCGGKGWRWIMPNSQPIPCTDCGGKAGGGK